MAATKGLDKVKGRERNEGPALGPGPALPAQLDRNAA